MTGAATTAADVTVQARLTRFVALLTQWNRSINLVSQRDTPLLWPRHIADALQLPGLCGGLPARAIDLGSGAGFPGLVLSICFGLEVTLIEEDQRKAAFLREAARATGAPATVLAGKIETARVPPAPLVMARGLATVSRLLAYAEPLLLPGGECWFPKSRTADAELAEAARQWRMQVMRVASLTDPAGVILRMRDIARQG